METKNKTAAIKIVTFLVMVTSCFYSIFFHFHLHFKTIRIYISCKKSSPSLPGLILAPSILILATDEHGETKK
jgi:hypothetical protein